MDLNKVSVARSRHDSSTVEKSGDCNRERVSWSNLSKAGDVLMAEACGMPPCIRIRCIESGVGGSNVDIKLNNRERGGGGENSEGMSHRGALERRIEGSVRRTLSVVLNPRT